MRMKVRMAEQKLKYKVKMVDNSSVFAISMRDIQTISRIDGEPYEGEYEVDPTFEIQTLLTAHKYMADNVTVHAIEVSTVSNPSGGNTVYIGGII